MSSPTKNDTAKPSTINLEAMPDQQLQELRQQVEVEFKKRDSRLKREARKQILQLAQQHDIDLSSLTVQPNDTVKYRDPSNQFNTWSGKGRQPAWVKKSLENGVKLDDLKS
jgi:DNA-binding protein H-NS